MSYGITAEGFVRMRLPEIREAIVADFRERLRASGITAEPETRPDSVLGELIDTFAEREAAMWEMAEAVHLSMYPSTATGVSLDRAISFSGATPTVPEPAAAYEVFYGSSGVVVPAGFQVRNASSSVIYELASEVVVSAASTVDATFVPQALPSTTFTVTIDGVAKSYTSAPATTLFDIISGIVAAIDSPGWMATSDGASVRISNISIEGAVVSLSAGMTFSEIGSRGIVRTLEPSDEVAAPLQISAMVSTANGLFRVANPTQGTAGRLKEEDFEKVERYRLGVFRLGAGTLPSIGPNIYESVTGVSRVMVSQNDSDATVAGLKPHSIHVVAEGGLDGDIAAAIYKFKGGGIDTNGAVSVALQTPEGQQDIQFDRPAPVYIWIEARITLKAEIENEPFPATGFEDIRRAMVAYGNTLDIGEDVIWQKLLEPAYETPGIATIELKIAKSTTPGAKPAPGLFLAQNIAISRTEAAAFDITRTEVV